MQKLLSCLVAVVVFGCNTGAVPSSTVPPVLERYSGDGFSIGVPKPTGSEFRHVYRETSKIDGWHAALPGAPGFSVDVDPLPPEYQSLDGALRYPGKRYGLDYSDAVPVVLPAGSAYRFERMVQTGGGSDPVRQVTYIFYKDGNSFNLTFGNMPPELEAQVASSLELF